MAEEAPPQSQPAVLDPPYRTLFVVDPDMFDAIRSRFDEPPRLNERLRRALQTPVPWA